MSGEPDVNATAKSKWGQMTGPCVGDFCLVGDRQLRIAAIRNGIVNFEGQAVHDKNRFYMNADGEIHFSGALLSSPTLNASSLKKKQGTKPKGYVIFPDDLQDWVSCRLFEAPSE